MRCGSQHQQFLHAISIRRFKDVSRDLYNCGARAIAVLMVRIFFEHIIVFDFHIRSRACVLGQ